MQPKFAIPAGENSVSSPALFCTIAVVCLFSLPHHTTAVKTALSKKGGWLCPPRIESNDCSRLRRIAADFQSPWDDNAVMQFPSSLPFFSLFSGTALRSCINKAAVRRLAKKFSVKMRTAVC